MTNKWIQRDVKQSGKHDNVEKISLSKRINASYTGPVSERVSVLCRHVDPVVNDLWEPVEIGNL